MVVIIKIIIPRGDRSDKSLSAPVIKRLEKNNKFECLTIDLIPGNYGESYRMMDMFIKKVESDLVFCTADRIEMTAAASAAFHNNVKIAHFYAGILTSLFDTWDCINRHVITLYSNIQFVESFHALSVVNKLFNAIQKMSNCYVVGISHLDDLEIDNLKVPSEPYDLIVINPTTTVIDNIDKDMKDIIFLPIVIQIEGNADGKISQIGGCKYYCTLPKAQYFGLIKHCNRFITNSSDAYYVAPGLGLKPEQIILVGIRNKERSTKAHLTEGASDIIVEVLEGLEL